MKYVYLTVSQLRYNPKESTFLINYRLRKLFFLYLMKALPKIIAPDYELFN